jgi:cytochrome c biogenesis protein CcdA
MGMQKANNARNMGLAALICSLLSLCISPIIALVLGILAISGASSAKQMLGCETPETKSARTMGIASLIITGLFFLLTIVFTVVYVIVLSEGLM